MVLSCPDPAKVKVVTATRELARRGLTLRRAKAAVEAALVGEIAIELPAVEDRDVLAGVLDEAGLRLRFLADDEKIDVRGLRARLQLSREQFALRFNLPAETVEKWETGERQPDASARAYLRVIARDPQAAMAAQEALRVSWAWSTPL